MNQKIYENVQFSYSVVNTNITVRLTEMMASKKKGCQGEVLSIHEYTKSTDLEVNSYMSNNVEENSW